MLLRLMLVACLTLRFAVALAQTVPPAASAGGIGTVAPVTTPQVHDSSQSATGIPLQVRVGSDVEGWIDRESMVTSFWGELPKLALAGFVGWLVAVMITNKWDLAKKRNEFDLDLVKDFYDAIGKFKAVGRQAEVYVRLPATTTPAQQHQRDATRDRMLQQAIELESQIDAVLAKVILEDRADKGVGDDERVRRLRIAGLVRVMIRNLREGLQHGNLQTPAFGTPEFYLSNRLLSDLGDILYTRALTVRDRKPEIRMHSADYLNLINYRTADLQIAAASLAPAVARFNVTRATARLEARRANVGRIFQAGRWGEVKVLAGQPAAVAVGATLAVEFATARVSDPAVSAAASAAFAAQPQLQCYLVLADGEARVLLCAANAPASPATFVPGSALPALLPIAPGVAQPLLAAHLLEWRLSEAAQTALNDVAAAPI
jgi:hypothetical protein